MITVVCYKWKPNPGYRSIFGAEEVNTLFSMVSRHYPNPFELVCITDDPRGIDTRVRVIPLWSDFANIGNPGGKTQPSCYRRLRLFDPETAQSIGHRLVTIDLDCVIVNDLSPLWDRPEDFIIWGDTARSTPYNGSMILMNAGARPRVWYDFDPKKSPDITKRRGFVGSDQAWISHCLPNEKKWTKIDGVYSYKNELKGQPLPDNARIVFFHGPGDPWDPAMHKKSPWIKDHYR